MGQISQTPFKILVRKGFKGSLGRVLEVDDSSFSNPYWIVAHVLVEIDWNEGLVESMEIVVGDKSHT